MSRRTPLFLIALALPLATLAGDGPSKVPPTLARVVRVVDGDTLVLSLDGRQEKARLIGVDTPETVHPSKPVERFGREASAFLRELAEGKAVRVEYEPAGDRRDRYGRLLVYLWRADDSRFVNREIIARGFGHAYTRYPFRFMEDFRKAERSAREKGLGLWAPEVKPPAPAPPSAVDGKATVYVTRTGAKYHAAGCRHLARSSAPMALAEAAKTRTACSVCKPPAMGR